MTPDDYIAALPDHQREPVRRLRDALRAPLEARGFAEQLSYAMIGYVVPWETYPPGYHADPSLPLPFVNLGAQKRHIAVYHLGLYADADLLDWFREAYAASVPTKLDMGKSCIRFRRLEHIPFELVGELATRMTAREWVAHYERQRGG